MANFYTADTHFWDYVMMTGVAQRPFRNEQAMNAVLISRWNATVKPGDTVYHLGDFAHERVAYGAQLTIFRLLNGRKILIRGNHDSDATANLPWSYVTPWVDVTTARGNKLRLSHRPFDHDGLLLHGHIHSKGDRLWFPQFDVGVDAHDFRPVPEHEIDRKAALFLRGARLDMSKLEVRLNVQA